MSAPTVLLLAGEASGDHHGAALARELKVHWPDVRLAGLGGPRMVAEGVDVLTDLDELNVMGFSDVLPKIPYFLKLERRVVRLMEESAADLVVLIDYPGFNMRIARRAHERGRKVLYYIAPQVWAWRTGRAKKLAEHTDRVAVILPFEADFLAKHGVDATYVGHPLLDREDGVTPRPEFFDRWGLDPSKRLLAVLPGSREQELRRHVAPFAEIARLVAERCPDVVPVFSKADSVHAALLHRTGFPLVGDTRALLRHADAALVKSGTSTLETALEGTPHVIAYIVSPLNAMIGRLVLDLPIVVGLPNLVAGESVVPEFLQDQVVPDTVADVLVELLDESSEARARQVEGLERVRTTLGEPGAAARVARLAVELVEGGT